MVQPLCKTVWRFLTKLNILLPCDPASRTLLGVHLKELKTNVHTKPAHGCFIAALLIITPSWK